MQYLCLLLTESEVEEESESVAAVVVVCVCWGPRAVIVDTAEIAKTNVTKYRDFILRLFSLEKYLPTEDCTTGL